MIEKIETIEEFDPERVFRLVVAVDEIMEMIVGALQSSKRGFKCPKEVFKLSFVFVPSEATLMTFR